MYSLIFNTELTLFYKDSVSIFNYLTINIAVTINYLLCKVKSISPVFSLSYNISQFAFLISRIFLIHYGQFLTKRYSFKDTGMRFSFKVILLQIKKKNYFLIYKTKLRCSNNRSLSIFDFVTINIILNIFFCLRSNERCNIAHVFSILIYLTICMLNFQCKPCSFFNDLVGDKGKKSN